MKKLIKFLIIPGIGITFFFMLEAFAADEDHRHRHENMGQNIQAAPVRPIQNAPIIHQQIITPQQGVQRGTGPAPIIQQQQRIITTPAPVIQHQQRAFTPSPVIQQQLTPNQTFAPQRQRRFEHREPGNTNQQTIITSPQSGTFSRGNFHDHEHHHHDHEHDHDENENSTTTIFGTYPYGYPYGYPYSVYSTPGYNGYTPNDNSYIYSTPVEPTTVTTTTEVVNAPPANFPTGNWASSDNGSVPDNAIPLNTQDANGNPVTFYYCRVVLDNIIYYGALIHNDGCYIQDESSNYVRFAQYDVLVSY